MLFWSKNPDVLQKNADISKINTILVLKAILSETAYMFAPKWQI